MCSAEVAFAESRRSQLHLPPIAWGSSLVAVLLLVAVLALVLVAPLLGALVADLVACLGHLRGRPRLGLTTTGVCVCLLSSPLSVCGGWQIMALAPPPVHAGVHRCRGVLCVACGGPLPRRCRPSLQPEPPQREPMNTDTHGGSGPPAAPTPRLVSGLKNLPPWPQGPLWRSYSAFGSARQDTEGNGAGLSRRECTYECFLAGAAAIYE